MLLFFGALLLIQAAAAPDPAQELIRLEQQLTDALVRYDVRTVDTLWADDLVFIGLNGRPFSKQERLSGLKAPVASSAATVVAATNDQVKVRLFGETAVVTLLAVWTTRTHSGESRDRFMTTHVWTKERGQWRLVSAHVSKVSQ